MLREKLETYLLEEGFYSLPTSLPELSAFVRAEHNLINVLQVIDYEKELYLSHDQYEELKDAVKNIFKERGIDDVHVMSLVLYDDISKAESFALDDRFCWFADKQLNKLVVLENQVEDFYGFKAVLQNFFDHYEEHTDNIDKQKEAVNSEKKTVKEYIKRMPVITAGMVIVNIIVYILCQIFGERIYSLGETGISFILNGEYYRLLTAIFLHADLDHIFGNMLLLYCLGEMFEPVIGKCRFFILYLLSGILGNVVSCLYGYYSGNMYVSLGASGAVFGLIGAILCMVVKGEKTMKITMNRMILLVIYCVYSSFTGENIDAAAHMGGLLSGFLLTFLLCMRRKTHES